MENIYNDPVIAAFWQKISRWMMRLTEDPSWMQFNQKKFGYTLTYDEDFEIEPLQDFVFDEKTAKEHAFILCYLELISCYNAIKDCEYYFRRFPFNGLPVRRSDYLTRNCEMFLNKLYEFRERIKKFGKIYKASSPKNHMDTGKVIKQYDNHFKYQLIQRNLLNHHNRFSDITLDKLAIMDVLKESGTHLPFLNGSTSEYRRACRTWIKRTQADSEIVKTYLVAITKHLLDHCDFLNVCINDTTSY